MIFGILYGTTYLVCASLGWYNHSEQLSELDKFRQQCKDDGLTLHLPSYHNGIEAYVTVNAEDCPNIPPSWLTRF